MSRLHKVGGRRFVTVPGPLEPPNPPGTLPESPPYWGEKPPIMPGSSPAGYKPKTGGGGGNTPSGNATGGAYSFVTREGKLYVYYTPSGGSPSLVAVL